MPQPRIGFQWPTAGERQVRCELQYATPATDEGGGRGEPVWTTFGRWWGKVTVVPVIPNETEAVLLYDIEGPYRRDLVEKFRSGKSVRVVTGDLTLKVFQVENPQLRRRTLIAHCANATNTQ